MAEALFRSILVPLDGSPFAEQALPLAAEYARRAGAILQLALVHHPVPPLATAVEVPDIEARLDGEAREREQSYLTALVDRIGASHQVPVTSVLLEGVVAEALQRQVESSSTDLIVLTTHGRGPMSRLWLGSVADQLMRRLHIPLLFVRPDAGSVPPTIRRLMVTLDGSPFAEQALAPALALALAFEAEVVLLLVIEPPVPIADPSGMIVLPNSMDAEKRMRESAASYLAATTARLKADGVAISSGSVDGHTAASAILAEVEAKQIDLLVIASHGAGGFERLLVGSVADKVIRGSRHPTLVVRPPKAASDTSA